MPRQWSPLEIVGVPDRLILFDGVCVLCSRWVRFVIRRDPAARFRFVAIQEPYGSELARILRIDADFPETNALVLGDRAYFKSDAAIRVLSQLPGWGWVRGLSWVPRPLRDRAYDVIARNRYRWFGRSEICLLPTADLAGRFLHDDAPPA
jgi:predicted DCC family thiol-disulfide oxidoreductase YuxK